MSKYPIYLKTREDRPPKETLELQGTVREIIDRVRREGEAAVRHYMEKFDAWNPPSFRVTKEEIDKAEEKLPEDLKQDIQFLGREIRKFAEAQRKCLTDFTIETLPGVHIGQKYVPIDSVGVYVPGGRYTLIASAQMSIVPAKVAKVGRIIACVPPKNGKISPAVLYSIHIAGADDIFSLGGAQAIAAMAYGMTELDAVDMISGPGNDYVVEAKRQLYGTVGIDFLPGPTEILIIADDSQDPAIVAADLVAQSEHDINSKAALITTSEVLGMKVMTEVKEQLADLETAKVAGESWKKNGEIIVVRGNHEASELADHYAPEHLQIMARDPDWFLQRLRNYGTLFLGEYANTTYSDKAVGPNHILPTNRGARNTGGLWVGKYLKNVTYQTMTRDGGSRVAGVASRIARAEGMEAHARSVDARIKKYGYD